ncbi:MAG TPA: hypothetical protein VLA12_13050, partial [Planctomycetaceae bacterium]|nr:hypothetical protein [Planctomycetaceae bacterium]
KDNDLSVINIGSQFVAVQDQKCFHDGVPDSFIAVDERVIPYDRKAQSIRFGLDGRVKLLTVKRHLWLRDGGLQTSQITHAVRSSGLLDDESMKFKNLCEREMTHQLSRR